METVDWWYYMGNKDGYAYLRNNHTFGSNTYRIRHEDVGIKQAFPLTSNRNQWVPLTGYGLHMHGVIDEAVTQQLESQP